MPDSGVDVGLAIVSGLLCMPPASAWRHLSSQEAAMGYQTRLPAAPLKRELLRTRAEYGITWDELADRLRISPSTLTRLLSARDISEPTADRIACRLGLHPLLLWPRYCRRITRNGESHRKGDESHRSDGSPLEKASEMAILAKRSCPINPY